MKSHTKNCLLQQVSLVLAKSRTHPLAGSLGVQQAMEAFLHVHPVQDPSPRQKRLPQAGLPGSGPEVET